MQDNIQRILNSRRNGLAHLQDYGLDDLSEIYRHLPSSAHQLQHAIETTVLKYEPRMRAVRMGRSGLNMLRPDLHRA